MLTLHGFSFSNYYNIVKHALLYKGVAFEENKVYPDMAELLAVSPAGKVPAMTTEDGVNLSESTVLLDYIEDAYSEVPLYPANASERGHVRQMIKLTELYIELPARRLLPFALGGGEPPEALKEEVRNTLQRGVDGLNALATFSPYMNGETLTLADIYLRYALAIPRLVGKAHLDWDILASIDGLAAWDELMAGTDIAQRIDADQKANAPEFMARLAAKR